MVYKDLIGLLGGRNVYTYAPNPVRWIDPNGLNSTCSLCVFANKSGSKGIRDIDLAPDKNGILPSQKGKDMPQGKSATRDPNKSPMTGHYHQVLEDTKIQEGLAVKHDGKDIISTSD